ncbi:MAG: tRNA lysidine(34) synthetase TilS [Acidobacteria bacterium]|nr:tRNA lysidine(34) synthetase TilS [Acidobacteriota bacterium]
MHKFVLKLLTEWRKLGLPFANETYVVAVSGGADSVALLAAVEELRNRKKLRHRFVAAHFDHGLRGAESERDAAFVRELAEKLRFELAFGKGNIPKAGNLEQNARLARYGFLRTTAASLHAGGIITAHTVNDQAETFLLNLIRGSGPTGLAAMRPVIPDFKLPSDEPEPKSEIRNPKSTIALLRPLLNWAKRTDTEGYCHHRGIEPRFDSMNEDLDFKRVRVRRVLLPLLAEFNPKIVDTLAATAGLMPAEPAGRTAEPESLPDPERKQLPLKELRALSKTDLYRILRRWLEFNGGNLRGLELKHIAALERLIGSRKSGRLVELPGGRSVIKEKGMLDFRRKI